MLLHFEDAAQAVVSLVCENPMGTSSEEVKRLHLVLLALCNGIVHDVARLALSCFDVITCKDVMAWNS